jgi:TP901 family phage tail tape measure protein
VSRTVSETGKSLSTKLTLPLVGLGALSAKTSIEFESAFAGVQKTVEATEPQLEALKKGFLELAREIPVSTTEIFGIGEAAGQLGIATDDILEFTKVMANLGATTNLSSEEAATSLAKFANITGLAAKDYERLGDVIVGLGNSLATTEKDIVSMASRLAGAGTSVGLTETQIVALAASLSSVGIEAESGGTAFSQVMKSISKEIGTGSERMKDFAIVAGKSTADFEKSWKDNTGEALLAFVNGLDRVQKEGANVNIVLDELGFEGIRISDSLLRASGASELFNKAQKDGTKFFKENNATQKEAQLRYATTQSKLILLKNGLEQLAAAFGDLLLPLIIRTTAALGPFVSWIRNLSPATKKTILVVAALVAAIGPLVFIVGKVILVLAFLAKTIAVGAAAIAFFTTPIGLIVGIFLGLAAAITTVTSLLVIFWDDIKQLTIDLGPTLAIIGAIAAAFIFLGNPIGLAVTAFTAVAAAIDAVFNKASLLKSILPEFIAKRIGLTADVTPKLAKGSSLGASIPNLGGQALARTNTGGLNQANKSETEITLKLVADQGTSATVERVQPKQGDAKIMVASDGFVGAR